MKSRSPSDLKEVSELRIYRGKKFAGYLRRTIDGCEFVFDEEFLADPHYSKLTYRIQKSEASQIHSGVNLPPFYAGLLPEGLRFKALVRELKTSEDDLFTLLAATGDRCIGDVYARAENKHQAEVTIPDVDQVDFYEFFAETLRAGMYARGDEGIAGVQEKISASMISFPVQIAEPGKSYILKLNPADKPNLIHNEWTSLRLGKKCGLETCLAKVVYDKNRNSGLLVERFDRVAMPDGGSLMIHQEDACQMLNRYPADKYRLSFREICEGVQDLATAPLVELLKCLQLYAFSYLIGNGDLHAKNISLQTAPDTGRIKLTPAYDLICTYIYKDHTMALKLDGRDRNIKRRHIVNFGMRLGLKEKAIEVMLNKLLARFHKTQDMLLEIPLLTNKDTANLKKMMTARMADLS